MNGPIFLAIFFLGLALLVALGFGFFILRELRKERHLLPKQTTSPTAPIPRPLAIPPAPQVMQTVVSTAPFPKPQPKANAKLFRRAQMARSESRFYDFLKETVKEEYLIDTKTPLRELFKRYGWLDKELYTMYVNGHADFVLLEPTLKNPIIAIELDGTTHNDPSQLDRDRRKEELFRRADMKLLRFQTGKLWGDQERQAIRDALPKRLS